MTEAQVLKLLAMLIPLKIKPKGEFKYTEYLESKGVFMPFHEPILGLPVAGA